MAASHGGAASSRRRRIRRTERRERRFHSRLSNLELSPGSACDSWRGFGAFIKSSISAATGVSWPPNAITRRMNHIQICFIRMDRARVDALRVLELSTVAETKADALRRLSRAVGRWIQNTDEGRRAWTSSSEDFNVGDLAESLSESGKAIGSLQPFLEKEGIARVKDLFVLTDAEHESYDRILADLEEA